MKILCNYTEVVFAQHCECAEYYQIVHKNG